MLFDLHVPERMRALVVAASFATHSKCFYTVYAISKKSHGTRTTFGIDHYSKAQSSRQGSHHYSTINLCSLGSHLKSLKLHTATPLSPLLIIFHLSLLKEEKRGRGGRDSFSFLLFLWRKEGKSVIYALFDADLEAPRLGS